MYSANDIRRFCLFVEAAFVKESNDESVLTDFNIRDLFESRFPLFEIPQTMDPKSVRSLVMDLFMFMCNEETKALSELGYTECQKELEKQAFECCSLLIDTNERFEFNQLNEYANYYESVLNLFSLNCLLKANDSFFPISSLILLVGAYLSNELHKDSIITAFEDVTLFNAMLDVSLHEDISDLRQHFTELTFPVGSSTFSLLDLMYSVCRSQLSKNEFVLAKKTFIDSFSIYSIEDITDKVDRYIDFVINSLLLSAVNETSTFIDEETNEPADCSNADLINMVVALKSSQIFLSNFFLPKEMSSDDVVSQHYSSSAH